jgi:hypothetical protein
VLFFSAAALKHPVLLHVALSLGGLPEASLAEFVAFPQGILRF